MSDPSLRSVENALDRIRSVANVLGATAPWVAGMTTPARRGGYDGGNRNADPTDGGSTAKGATNGKLALVRKRRREADQHILDAAKSLELAMGAYASACKVYDESYGPDEIGVELPARMATRAEVAYASAKQAYRDSQRPRGTPHGEG